MRLPQIIERARDSVVQITYTITGLPHEDLVRLGARGAVWSFPLGTGFVLNDDGYVVTAKHVVDAIAQTAADIPNGRHLVGVGFNYPNREGSGLGHRGSFSVILFDTAATSERHDLALLKLRANPFRQSVEERTSSTGAVYTPRASQLATERPADGDPVAICGYPLREAVLVSTAGAVASAWSTDLRGVLRRAPNGGYEPVDVADRYLLDVQSNGGNSGGPVVRLADGAVIGLLVAGRLTTLHGAAAHADLAVAIPAVLVAEFAEANGIAWSPALEPNR